MKHVIDEIYDDLYYLALNITGNKEYSRDLVHDAILEYLEKTDEETKERLESTNRVKPYIYSIMNIGYNSTASTTHKNYRENQSLNIDDDCNINLDDMVYDIYIPEEDTTYELMFDKILGGCTDKRERQILIDRVLVEMTYKDIALKHSMPLFKVMEIYKTTISKIKNYGNN